MMLCIGLEYPTIFQVRTGAAVTDLRSGGVGRRLLVLLDVELPQQHDGLLSEDTTVDGVRPIDTGASKCQRRCLRHLVLVDSLRVDIQDASRAAKALVPATEIDTSDAVLA
jgi:hypothetical protein